jgi:hypothetical protein
MRFFLMSCVVYKVDNSDGNCSVIGVITGDVVWQYLQAGYWQNYRFPFQVMLKHSSRAVALAIFVDYYLQLFISGKLRNLIAL